MEGAIREKSGQKPKTGGRKQQNEDGEQEQNGGGDQQHSNEDGEDKESGDRSTESSVRQRRFKTNGQASKPEGERSLLHDSDDNNPWSEGYQKRRELRRKSGHSPRNDYVTPKDPNSSIPHASSGKTRHSGRGGFPGIDGFFIQLFNRLFPSTVSRVSSMIRRYEEDGLHSSHPVRELGKMIQKPFADHEDKCEKREAQHAKWLPPGVRAVVVGRNSQFFEEELNDDDLALLGALEYRATSVLTYLLVAVSNC